ncbi:unnamed protein product [Allacma fusca]|uniref:Anoctamin n=1 Tax=Allacma fusca TaxID=39272 RepID=A0A8J2LF19_9HEXA|nr:unnamed protein product [Allacma fusca]
MSEESSMADADKVKVEDGDLELVSTSDLEEMATKTHHMVVREYPAWTDAPKSAATVRQNQSHSGQLTESYKNKNISKQNFINHNSPYQHFISQLGTISYDIPDSNPEQNSNNSSPNPKLGLPSLGYDNPGLVADSDFEIPVRTNNNLLDQHHTHSRSTASSANRSAKSFRDSLHFIDGRRRIDLVLVYEEDLDFAKEQRRKTFLRNIVAEGLEIEIENPDPTKRFNQETRTHFVKIHAPWPVLTKYAEIMNIKMPIRKLISISYKAWDRANSENQDKNRIVSWWKALWNLEMLDYNHSRIPPEPSFTTASFSRQKEECFIIKDRETFFTTAQRSQIVWQILTRIRFEENARDKCGIRRLLNDATFVSTFPLHEGPHDEEDAFSEPNDRRLLYTEWAHFSNWYKKQPLWLIRKYFGDKVALYFAWLGFYTGMLVPASVVGILCFLFGMATIQTDYNTPSREICAEEGTTIMCPLCGHCELWQLNDSCTFSKLTYFFDNPATVFFAVFMAFWATSFLEFWKRKHAVISWEWDLHNFEVEEEPRPEFEAAVKTFRINPVTQLPEPYLSFWSKAVRMLAVCAVVFFLLFIVAFVVVGIIIYRLVMMSVLYSTTNNDVEFFKDNAKIIASVSAAIINLAIVVFLHNRVYYNVAIWLTNSEYPRTQTEYEDSFTFKMFLFQFINYYSYLIYIAFFKGRFFRHPGESSDNAFEKIRGDMCDPAGCLSELFIQLSIIMIGKQFFNNFMELFMPKVSNWCRRMRYTSTMHTDTPTFFTRWEQDYNLKKVDQLALFHEYLEMVIQYGFVTLFVAAFPLAPFFALLNNIVEIRLDAYKWITQMRRPLAERVEDIGAWYGILQGITYTAVVTNGFVIAYTSDIIPRLVYMYNSPNGTLADYINSSLSVFPTSNYSLPEQQELNGEKAKFCRYRGYYNPPWDDKPYEPSPRYWHIMAARLAFVAVFEHLAFALTGIMAFAIPDVPREIRVQIQREKLLATEALYENDLARLQREKENHFEDGRSPDFPPARRGSSVGHDLIRQFHTNERNNAKQMGNGHGHHNHE